MQKRTSDMEQIFTEKTVKIDFFANILTDIEQANSPEFFHVYNSK